MLTRGFLSDGTSSPLLAVASSFIDRTPGWLKDIAVSSFGTNDKIALFAGMAVVLALVCAVVGEIGAPRPGRPRGRRTLGLVLFALVGVVGVAAVLSRAGASVLDIVPTVLGVVAGMLVLTWLWRRLGSSTGLSEDSAAPSRRAVVGYAGGLTIAGLLAVAAGRALSRAAEVVETARQALGLPRVAAPVSVPAGAQQGHPGQAPYVTDNSEFYRIDTAPAEPIVDPETWRLRVWGMVEREVEITYADLVAEPMMEALVTLCCVSNWVGGPLVGNAVWTGWPIRELLSRAGVRPGADMVLSTSADGWTAGTPLEALTDDRNALLAVGMNGEPLPVQHGFPVRMVVPGLYGYVSATKWVTELKVTTFEQDMGYWTDKGWSARGPIKTQSRIDVPREGEDVNAGQVVVAGVAWAQHRGVDGVQVQVDDGDWQDATLALEPSIDSWRQWSLVWQAEPGEHTLRVRATDTTGETQTEALAAPAPDGATGWHTVEVSVAGS